MADNSYPVNGVYRDHGGGNLVVPTGADIEVESGGDINLQSGGSIAVASGGDITIASGGIFDNAGAVAGATITVGSETNDVRPITIQLTDAAGADLTSVQAVYIGMYSAATPTAFATGGSTGIAIGADGALLALVAKKFFVATCEADGDIDLTWTDTGTEAAYLGVHLPNGKVVMSAIIQNAGG